MSDMKELQQSREKVIIRTSIIGILTNVLLASAKAAVGLLSHSIAVVLDAVNNLTDVMSSIVTIVGTKLADRKPDKKHPLGHGRIEYISAMIVAAIVLYAGVTSGYESVKKLFAPEESDYSVISLVIISVSIVAKLVLGAYVKKKGEKVNSGALTASGADATFDAVLTFSTLLCALLAKFTGVRLEAVIGVLISIVIIKAGIEMLVETIDEMLGKRAEPEFLKAIRATICEDPDVRGAFDLILHSYGPERYIGSVHVEISDTMTANEIDMMQRRLAERVYREHGVMLAGIGIYSVNTSDPKSVEIRNTLTQMVMEHDGLLQMHGFYLNEAEKSITFDIIIDYAIENREEIYRHICKDAQEAYPEYTFRITLDIDYL